MFLQSLGIRLVSELLQEFRGPLDVREEERDGSSR
jgi:hypothetical protein